MTTGDVPQVVAVHLQAFAEFFLAQLGPRFLRQYYLGILQQRQLAFVAEHEGAVCGLVCGIDHAARFYRHLALQRGPAMAWAALPHALKRPSALGRLLRTLSKKRSESSEGATTLTSLAVLPALQGHGAGQALVQAYLAEARVRKLKRVVLETDAADNDRTLRFYRQQGFAVFNDYVTPEGRPMLQLALALA